LAAGAASASRSAMRRLSSRMCSTVRSKTCR
jgi:hypothetical protein